MFILTKTYADDTGADLVAVSTEFQALALEAATDFHGEGVAGVLDFSDTLDKGFVAHTPYHGITYLIQTIKAV